MVWLDDLTAHLGKPLAASGGTSRYGSTCCVQWPNRTEVIVNNDGPRFMVYIRCNGGRVRFARTGEPTDRQVLDLCILAGLLPMAASDVPAEAVRS